MITQDRIWLDGHITHWEYRTADEAEADGKHEFTWMRDVATEPSLSQEERQELIRDVTMKRRACAKAHKASWQSGKEADGTWHSWCPKCGIQIQFGFNPLA